MHVEIGNYRVNIGRVMDGIPKRDSDFFSGVLCL